MRTGFNRNIAKSGENQGIEVRQGQLANDEGNTNFDGKFGGGIFFAQNIILLLKMKIKKQ